MENGINRFSFLSTLVNRGSKFVIHYATVESRNSYIMETVKVATNETKNHDFMCSII